MPRISGKARKERVVFTRDDMTGIHDTFGCIIGASPSRNVKTGEFSRILKREKIGKKLVEKFGRDVLLNKVRTERKKHLSTN